MFNLLQQYGVSSYILTTIIIVACYCVACLLLWLLVRYILDIFSNTFLKWEYGVLCALAAVYLGYVAYQYTLLFCIVIGLILITLLIASIGFASDYINKYRCANCHIFVKPIIVKETEGLFHLGDYKKTGKKVLLSSTTRSYIENGEEVTETFQEYNYETVSNVFQDMEYKNRCPECSHEWNSKGSVGHGSTRGPICYKQSISRSITWQERETEYEVIKDGYDNEIDRREVGSRTITRSRDGGGEDWGTHDVDHYKPYFHRYINGDRNAINEYYDKYWGRVYLPK